MKKILVFDIGTGESKIGFAGDESPVFIFPTIVGRPKYNRKIHGLDLDNATQKIMAVGFECNGGIHNISYPIENGQIKDWDGIKAIFDYAFENLKLEDDISNYGIVLTDSIYSNKFSRRRVADMLFNQYRIKAFYIDFQPYYSFISKEGLATGILVEIGDGITQIFPCYKGNPDIKGMRRFPIGGLIITDYLMKNLNTQVFNKNHLKDISKIKEKYCRVSYNYEEEIQNIQPIQFTYNSCDFSINHEQIKGPEILFQPNINSFQDDGLHKIINDAILDCNENIQNILYQRIIITGGLANMGGLRERLEKEIKILAPDKEVNVIVMPNPSLSAWRGASIYSQYQNYFLRELAVSQDEYIKNGDQIIDEKCFALGNRESVDHQA